MPEALYAPLPSPGGNLPQGGGWFAPTPFYTADQMRSYADATCALRGAQKESVPPLTWADGMREAADMCAAQAARAVDLRWTPQPDHVAARALKDMQSQILRFVELRTPTPEGEAK